VPGGAAGLQRLWRPFRDRGEFQTLALSPCPCLSQGIFTSNDILQMLHTRRDFRRSIVTRVVTGTNGGSHGLRVLARVGRSTKSETPASFAGSETTAGLRA
jgi:hypothetical protein